jgi:hypothetical protein
MIIIDGVQINVPIISIQRKFEFLDKFAERDNSGQLRREMIGGYANYSIQFGTGADVAAYAALWEKITEPEEFHTVAIPDGDGVHTFEAYFSGISDSMFKYKEPQAFYKSLTLNIISRSPTRK